MDKIKETMEMLGNISWIAHFPKLNISSIFEIMLLAFIFYYVAKSLRGTRAWMLLKGVTIMLSFYAVSYLLKLDVIVIIFQNLILFLGIAIVIIIQPELRKLIERIGANNLNVSFKNLINSIFKDKNKEEIVYKTISDFTIQELVKGSSIMGKAKTGALIVIEGLIPLNEYIESGIKINADITSQLLVNIFEHNTPLHDGAVIIQKNKIKAATCYLPLSDSKKINKELGTRHRAGIGISECTDAFVIIVSEETGAISICRSGKIIHNVDREKLQEELKQLQDKTSSKTQKKKSKNIRDRNIPLKIACLAGTFLLWAIVIAETNPIVSTTFNEIPIELLNTTVITETGKTYEIIGKDTVKVTVKDRKDVIDKISSKDIKIIADFSKLSYVNSITLDAYITSSPNSEVTLVNNSIQVSLEDVITTEVNIDINHVGEPNNNYYISDIQLNSETIIISGAKSVINTIDKVVVDIDNSRLTEDSVIKLMPSIYDKNGKQLNNDKFTLNHNEIQATVSLYKTKLVPLKINVINDNEVLKGIIKSIDYETKEIYITGPDEILERWDRIEVDIPLDITLNEISKSQFIKNVTLQNHLPDGVLVTPQFGKINLVVDFLDFHSNAIGFTSEQLNIEGLKEKLVAKIEYADLTVEFVSDSVTVQDLTVANIRPYIDLSDLKVGEHEVTVQYNEADAEVFKNLTVKVTINKE